jgi:hypothetical protein
MISYFPIFQMSSVLKETGDVESFLQTPPYKKVDTASGRHVSPVDAKNGAKDDAEAPADRTAGRGTDTSSKQQSVLQAKLTKLAIQIGYAGM